MDLILWRHAEAEDSVPDSERKLTAKGCKQAEKVGGWLAERLPDDARILVSPAARAQQTAAASSGPSTPCLPSVSLLRTNRSSRPPAGPTTRARS